MNIDRDKLIEMAKDAGFYSDDKYIWTESKVAVVYITETLAKFASLVSAHAITSMQGDSEPVVYQRFVEENDIGWIDVRVDDIPHYKAKGQLIRGLVVHDRVTVVSDTNTDGWVRVPIEPTEEMIKAYIEFMDKSSYLHHPDVPYNGTVNGDCEKQWYVRFVIGSYKAMINAISQDKGESV